MYKNRKIRYKYIRSSRLDGVAELKSSISKALEKKPSDNASLIKHKPIPPKNNINLTIPSISRSKKDIYIFFHICCIHKYIFVTNEMINELLKSGLYDESKKIFYTILGNMDSNLRKRIISLNKFELIHLSHDITEVEYPTLINLYNFTQKNDAYIMYIHTKGVSLPQDSFRQYWRKRLIQKVIKEYKVCISFLNEGSDVCGSGWKEKLDTETNYNQGEYEHFSGNFWWSKSEFIKKLPNIFDIRDNFMCFKKVDFLKYRVQCEFWVGMAENINVGVNGELNKEYSNCNFYSL